ncbi:MAG TPA: M23 family metallopeptidase [Pseudonocardiaceae bacterium]|jgi:hypothetical protein
MLPHTTMTRRALFGLGAAAAGAVVLPGAGPAWADSLIDPYSGAIPLMSPLVEGTYQAPVTDNWHAAREGRTYLWNHLSDARRAHDGVDLYPTAGAAPTVYAPLAGTVAAICLRSANTVDASVTYQASPATPPPWDYSQAIDDMAGLPLYGNFVWLYSTDERSRGYFVFCCHLDNEPTIQALSVDQPVSEQTRIGVVGDTGNAAGTSQLHVEIHYPRGSSYPCRRCTPPTALTSIDPAASLRSATPRPLAAI